MTNYETRNLVTDVTVEGRKLIGRPIVYRADSHLLTERGQTFVERFMPGSVSSAIKGNHIRALVDHDSGKLLGTQQAGTLRISEDAEGVRVEVDMPDTSYARDLATLMERGDIKGMSFAFRPAASGGETWKRENGQTVREINRAEIDEVSFLANPAYPSTTAAIRSLDGFLAGTPEQVNEEQTAARPLLDEANEQAASILI